MPRGEAGPQLPGHGDRCPRLMVGDSCVCLCQGGRAAGGRQAGITCQQQDLGTARTGGNVPGVCGPRLGAGWAGAGAGQPGASSSSLFPLCWPRWLSEEAMLCVFPQTPRENPV